MVPSLPETEAIVDGIYRKTIAETLMDPNNDSVSEEFKVEDLACLQQPLQESPGV